jgi:pheromone a factor receptor
MADIPFTVFSFLSMVLCIFPAYFNWKIPLRPWATLIIIGWIFIANLVCTLDSIIWRSNNTSSWWDGHVYCDIDARIKDMVVIGVPGAAVGICRFLADATNPDPSQKDLKHSRFRRNMIDLFLGVLLPVILEGLKYICEYSRYHIRGVNGCVGTIINSWPSIVVYIMWAPLLCLVTSVYSGTFVQNFRTLIYRHLPLSLVGPTKTT